MYGPGSEIKDPSLALCYLEPWQDKSHASAEDFNAYRPSPLVYQQESATVKLSTYPYFMKRVNHSEEEVSNARGDP